LQLRPNFYIFGALVRMLP